MLVGVTCTALAATACVRDPAGLAGVQPTPAPAIKVLPVPQPGRPPVRAEAGGPYVLTSDNVALPSRTLTPGATFPDVTSTTVCEPHYSMGVRQPRYNDKVAAFAAYGVSMRERNAYQVDRLVPVSLGGSNAEGNLWPQPETEGRGAAEKDRLEQSLHEGVCSGRLPLADAQAEISRDWWTSYLKRLRSGPATGAGSTPSGPGTSPPDPVTNFGPCAKEGAVGRTASKGIRFTCTRSADGKLRWSKRY